MSCAGEVSMRMPCMCASCFTIMTLCTLCAVGVGHMQLFAQLRPNRRELPLLVCRSKIAMLNTFIQHDLVVFLTHLCTRASLTCRPRVLSAITSIRVGKCMGCSCAPRTWLRRALPGHRCAGHARHLPLGKPDASTAQTQQVTNCQCADCTCRRCTSAQRACTPAMLTCMGTRYTISATATNLLASTGEHDVV